MLCCATLSLTVLLSRLKDQLRWGDCPVDADVESDMAAEVAGLPVQAGWRPRTAKAQASSSATPSRSPSPAKSICAMNRCALGFCPSPPSCLFTICQESSTRTRNSSVRCFCLCALLVYCESVSLSLHSNDCTLLRVTAAVVYDLSPL